MRFFIQYIHSGPVPGFSAQIDSCLDQIKLISSNLLVPQRIVKVTLFTRCIGQEEYVQKMNFLCSHAELNQLCQAPVSLVSQPPLNGGITMEVWLLDFSGMELTFTYQVKGQSSCLRIEDNKFICLFSTHHSADLSGFRENARGAFEMLDATLNSEGFGFQDIVRQWNYIEEIILPDPSGSDRPQNYQIFNDIRSAFYQKADFRNGYPSATGIGVANGGCTIATIALKENRANSVKPIVNILQANAYNYSNGILTGNCACMAEKAFSPKFERGKYMKPARNGFIFVSGTASIIGEKTVFEEDIVMQTKTSLVNIERLISADNLMNNNISTNSRPGFISFIAYLRNVADYPVVQSLCEDYFGSDNGIFVKADICRSNLLVEIEANYEIN